MYMFAWLCIGTSRGCAWRSTVRVTRFVFHAASVAP